MTISGTNEIELTDILVGEVWLCGGQSNMATMLNPCLSLFNEDELPASPFRTDDWER